MYDTDGSGYIDFTEFMVVFHILNDGTPEEVMSKIFRVFDLNGDGVITAAEMNKIIKVSQHIKVTNTTGCPIKRVS